MTPQGADPKPRQKRRPTPASVSPKTDTRWQATALAVVLIVLGVVAAYHHTLQAPFLMDDLPSIVDNTTIRSFGAAWSPPRGSGLTVSGRPLLNVSLALNYAISGTEVWSYHALNILIHVLCGCLLFGVVRRTLLLPSLQTRVGGDAWWLALAAALLWTLHPLQTESVTYVVQRAESLVGLWYILTFYCFIRSIGSAHRRSWSVAAFASSLAGMATKEVMVTAPVLLLLYDRIYLTGSWSETWRLRAGQHLAFASGWLLLGALVLASGFRGGTVGFQSPASYALHQTVAIVTYLKLAIVPVNLVFDYGVLPPVAFREIAPQVLVFLLLVAAVLVLAFRAPKAGYCGLFFLVVLAPTSSVVPVVTQTMAEHRMYLPLAGVVVLAVVLAHLVLGRPARWLLAVLAIVLAAASYQRNALYQSSLAVWQDAAAKRPGNARAHVAVGVLEEQAGRSAEAEAAYKRALQIEPGKAEAATNLGQVLRRAGRYDEAEAILRGVIDRLEGRERAIALNNLADVILARPGREAEAIERLQEAALLAPDQTGVHFNLARLLARIGRASESLPHFEMALRARADDVALRRSYAAALMATGNAAKAIPEFETVIRQQPESAGNLNDLGVAQALAGRHAEARTTFARALALDPAYQQARENLARVDRELND